ncbi:MAG: TolC family protein [Chloroflexota bacterium]
MIIRKAKLPIALALCLAATLSAFAQQEVLPAPKDTLRLTLREALELGRKNNYAARIALSRVSQAEARTNETSAAMLPQLKFSGGYTRLSEVDPYRITIPGAPPRVISPAIFNAWVSRFTLQQPIYMGGRLSGAREIARLNEQASRFDYSRDSAQMELDVTNAYWSVYRADENLKNITQNIEQARAHLADIRNFRGVGLATENDVLKVQVQLANAELALIDARNASEISRLGLASAMGLDVTRPVDIVRETLPEAESLPPLSSFISQARRQRPELRAMELRERAGEEGVNIARAGWLPQVSAAFNYNYLNPNNRIQPARPEFKGTWDAGIVLNYDIWTWFTPRYQTQQAEETLEQTRLQGRQLTEAVSLEVSSNYLQASRALERITVARQAVVQAEENFRVTNERFRSGVALSSELLDAETALLVARINLTTAIADWQTSLARLSKSVGK